MLQELCLATLSHMLRHCHTCSAAVMTACQCHTLAARLAGCVHVTHFPLLTTLAPFHSLLTHSSLTHSSLTPPSLLTHSPSLPPSPGVS